MPDTWLKVFDTVLVSISPAMEKLFWQAERRGFLPFLLHRSYDQFLRDAADTQAAYFPAIDAPKHHAHFFE